MAAAELPGSVGHADQSHLNAISECLDAILECLNATGESFHAIEKGLNTVKESLAALDVGNELPHTSSTTMTPLHHRELRPSQLDHPSPLATGVPHRSSGMHPSSPPALD